MRTQTGHPYIKMKFDPKKHRRSIRAPDYDYSLPGAYFVTIATYQRQCLFGDVVDEEMRLNKNGQIVEYAWNDLPNHYPHAELGTYIIMPNHFHGIIILIDTVGAGLRPAPTTQPIKRHGLHEILRALKSFSARRINEQLSSPGVPVWQRNYYEHIIRDDDDLNRIHLYIEANSLNWATDEENPMLHTS